MGRETARNIMMRDRARGSRYGMRNRDYNMDNDYENYDSEYDGRRGVKGTGRYGIGGSRYYGRDRAYEEDYGDYNYEEDYNYDDNEYDSRRSERGERRDYARGSRRGRYRGDRNMYDYGESDMKLTKKDMREWKENLENADGTDGAHFELPQIEQAVQSMGIQMRGYDLKELCLATNMLYSDYCKELQPFIPREKETMVYVKMAKAFLEDPDASLKGSEKLATYYYTIVKDDEE